MQAAEWSAYKQPDSLYSPAKAVLGLKFPKNCQLGLGSREAVGLGNPVAAGFGALLGVLTLCLTKILTLAGECWWGGENVTVVQAWAASSAWSLP